MMLFFDHVRYSNPYRLPQDALLERLTAASKSTVGAVWTYAEAGNTAGVRAALAAGGSTEEADEVSVCTRVLSRCNQWDGIAFAIGYSAGRRHRCRNRSSAGPCRRSEMPC